VLAEDDTTDGFDLAVVEMAVEDRFTAVLVAAVDVGPHEVDVVPCVVAEVSA
jgi:hypothetical protein